MKKILFLLLNCLLPILAEAEYFSVGNYHFSTLVDNPDEVQIYYSGSDDIQILEIPETVDYNGKTYKVTYLASIDYRGDTDFRIVIPNSIKTIAYKAFYNCSSLTGDLIIPSSVTTIEDYAFYRCYGLTGSLSIPSSVTTIGNYAFWGCKGLTGSLSIPSSVTTIGRAAFSGCSGFSGSFSIPSPVTTIGEFAFADCGFTQLVFPPSLETIVSGLFSSCTRLAGDLIIPSSVKTIGSSAFSDCTGFTGSLSIPSSVTTIGEHAFEGCTGFTGVLDISASISMIKPYTFSHCTGFTQLILSDKITEIADHAFWYCKGLKKLTIPDSVEKIEDFAFEGCSSIESLVLGKSVNHIGQYAFSYCRNLSGQVIIPENVEMIEHDAFKNCEKIQSIVFTSSNTTIWALAFNGADGLEYIVSQSKTPPNAKTFAFPTSAYEKPLYVPEESISLYRNAVYEWYQFKYINPIKSTETSITLNVKSLTLNIGASEKLTATVTPENTSNKTITWMSDNEDVATVAADGTVTAISVGVANITATCGNVSATCMVTVNPVTASGITLNASNLTLHVGQTDKLTATVTPENTSDKTITWESDNEDVATVAADGTVTAISVGVANITATCGNVSATCMVTVNPVTASEITLNASNLTLHVGQTDKLAATVTPENTSDKTITWESDNEDVATVAADGTVTAISVGVANITATCGNVTASCKVTVKARPETPRQYTRKGNGKSCTFVVMMGLSDEELSRQVYRFVYGYTDAMNEDHIITTGANRYCHTTAPIYNDFSNDFWVVAYWNEGNTVVTSVRRHLDGSTDDDLDQSTIIDYLKRSLANNLDNWIHPTSRGALINIPGAEVSTISVYTINGVQVYNRSYDDGTEVSEEIILDRFAANAYIITAQSGEVKTTKKIIIR